MNKPSVNAPAGGALRWLFPSHFLCFAANPPLLLPLLCSLTESGAKFFSTLTILGIDF
jgi:hypothetical protein